MNAFRFFRSVISVALAIVAAISLFTLRATAAGRIELINESAQYLRVSLAVDFAPSVEEAPAAPHGRVTFAEPAGAWRALLAVVVHDEHDASARGLMLCRASISLSNTKIHAAGYALRYADGKCSIVPR